jgi:hypothetical protein
LALACRSCNLWKAAHRIGHDPETNTDVRLYHPRVDRWDAHFTVERTTGEIHGCTTIGRATITRLRLNAPLQQAARQQWMRLGLFP